LAVWPSRIHLQPALANWIPGIQKQDLVVVAALDLPVALGVGTAERVVGASCDEFVKAGSSAGESPARTSAARLRESVDRRPAWCQGSAALISSEGSH